MTSGMVKTQLIGQSAAKLPTLQIASNLKTVEGSTTKRFWGLYLKI